MCAKDHFDTELGQFALDHLGSWRFGKGRITQHTMSITVDTLPIYDFQPLRYARSNHIYYYAVPVGWFVSPHPPDHCSASATTTTTATTTKQLFLITILSINSQKTIEQTRIGLSSMTREVKAT